MAPASALCSILLRRVPGGCIAVCQPLRKAAAYPLSASAPKHRGSRAACPTGSRVARCTAAPSVIAHLFLSLAHFMPLVFMSEHARASARLIPVCKAQAPLNASVPGKRTDERPPETSHIPYSGMSSKPSVVTRMKRQDAPWVMCRSSRGARRLAIWCRQHGSRSGERDSSIQKGGR